MLITNMHHFFLRAIVETYTLIPVGHLNFSSEKIMTTIIQFFCDYMLIAFQLCLPVVAAIMLLNAVLGILTKTAPQIHMFSIGVQLKIFTGMTVLFVTIGLLPSISDFIFKEMRIMMTAMVESMR